MTPDHDHYDSCNYDPDVPDLEVKVTPEVNDPLVGAEVRLPLGGIGRVASRKRDANGNPTGLSNDNRILDTHKYVIQFDDGDSTELTANKIAESMYSQCDPDGYEYYLFDAIINLAGRHLTSAPAAMTYASVISRETVCIALTIAALNSLDVRKGDVMNA